MELISSMNLRKTAHWFEHTLAQQPIEKMLDYLLDYLLEKAIEISFTTEKNAVILFVVSFYKTKLPYRLATYLPFLYYGE